MWNRGTIRVSHQPKEQHMAAQANGKFLVYTDINLKFELDL
jgi:hypothetical protein